MFATSFAADCDNKPQKQPQKVRDPQMTKVQEPAADLKSVCTAWLGRGDGEYDR